MSLEIDSRVGNVRTQYATQTPPDICQEIIDLGFRGDETSDYYEGLLFGYATSYDLLNQMDIEHAKILIGSFVAHIAEFTIKQGTIHNEEKPCDIIEE